MPPWPEHGWDDGGPMAQGLEHQPLLERLNEEIKGHPNVVSLFPNDGAIARLVASQLLEQQQEWLLERRRFFFEATMARIPEPEEPLGLTDADPAESAAATIR